MAKPWKVLEAACPLLQGLSEIPPPASPSDDSLSSPRTQPAPCMITLFQEEGLGQACYQGSQLLPATGA